MNLGQLCRRLEQLAPPVLSADWDNNGLLAGDPAGEVGRVLLAVDLTEAVLREAVAASAQAVICHHPPILRPLRRLRADEPSAGGLVFQAVRQGLALYAMHTTLDAAADGVNDALADALGLADARPLAAHSSLRPEAGGPPAPVQRCKLITFVPPDAVDRVAEAVFAAGGGRIGPYSRCSFRCAGVGTFFGEQGAAPAVGQAGRFETADEVRLEIELPAACAADAVAALRKTHPYQTVAFDLVPLAEIDERVGLGRIGRLGQPADLGEMVRRIKAALKADAVWLAKPAGTPADLSGPLIERAACCSGSGGSLFRRALADGAKLYLTGELGHHDALEAAEAGMAVIAVGHWTSERPVLERLAGRIAQAAPTLDVRISQADAAPYRWA